MIRPFQLKTFGLPRVSLRLSPLYNPVPATTRAASLSAIHRGLRQSERAQYGEAGPRPVSRRGFENLNDDIRRTQKSLDGATSNRMQKKLLKKLEKKESKRDGNGPQSRRKRFHDPESEHGKQSLVYHAKHGALKDMVDQLDEPVRPRTQPSTLRGKRRLEREQQSAKGAKGGRITSIDFKQRMLDGQTGTPPPSTAPRRDKPVDSGKFEPRRADASTARRSDRVEQRGGERDTFRPRRSDMGGRSEGDSFRSRRSDVGGRSENDSFRSRGSDVGGRSESDSFRPRRSDAGARNESDGVGSRADRRPQYWGEARERTQARDGREGTGRYERSRVDSSQEGEGSLDISAPKPRERSKGNMMPLTIKYTTAASQFLYGRSVVRSALEQARRKMYKLYIYAGENRQEMGEINDITRLAKRHSVPITIVPQEDQRLMDKMSAGRPHNGFVLETSPIPQKPIKALGKVEESVARNGFHVTLDRQTTEEEEVNGTDTFVRRVSGVTAKPFVLLLDEILDPGNLGAMLRTASYLGVDAVGITNRATSRLTPVVLKSAAGAVEEISIFSVESPAKFLQESRKAGWRSYAAVAPPSGKLAGLHKHKFISTGQLEKSSPLSKDPCILVLGNEGYGLSKQVKVAADYEVSVPRYVHHSCVDSLNVSVATGLLCHSFVKKAAAGEDLAEELPEPEEEEQDEEEEEEETSSKPAKDVMF